jgi:hypothetical protein
MSACGTVRSDLQFLFDDLARQAFDAGCVGATRSRQPDVRCIDTECIHQVKQFNLLFDAWFTHGWRLQSIAERLVIKTDGTFWCSQSWLDSVPIVNEFVDCHCEATPKTAVRIVDIVVGLITTTGKTKVKLTSCLLRLLPASFTRDVPAFILGPL